MRLVTFVLAISLAAAARGAPQPVCTNGSFERLAPGGFPVDWAPVGSTVEISSDAHSGRHSLRLWRTAETPTRETGLNRAVRTADGRRTALVERLEGGIDFYYKAVGASAAKLNVYAIPMNEEGVEGTGSQRATFTVPDRHVGDGRWHHARLKYDFTGNPKVKRLHFAARIVGTAGELLLDDFSYVDRVGAILRVGTLRLEEDADSPGRRCTVRAAIENAGDAPARDLRASLLAPAGLEAKPTELPKGDLAPDEKARAAWSVEGGRTEACTFRVTAVSGEAKALGSLDVAPGLVIRSFGPVAPVAAAGEPTSLECVLENTGGVILLGATARFELPSGNVTETCRQLAPGRSTVLRASFRPGHQTPVLRSAVRVGADNVADELSAETTLVVGAPGRLPPPSGNLRAAATDEQAVLENRHVRLAFRRNAFGFGPGELSVATAGGWQTVAWLPRLTRVVHRISDGTRQETTVFAERPTKVDSSAATAGLTFHWTARDADGAAWRMTCAFALAGGEKTIFADYRLACDEPRALLAFDGPMLYALDREEAVFPGLEWLVDDEVSSGTLEIVRGHPHQVRYVVHPNMVTIPAIGIHSGRGTVGLVWDVHQKWDGVRDRPSAVFASPDRFGNQRAHLAGLFLPTVPEFVEPNRREASRPYPLEANAALSLRASIYADAAATGPLAAVDEWVRQQGWPRPAPLPHGSYEREIEFSMRAYLESLWMPETREWWITKGNVMLAKTGRPRAHVADLLVGEILSSDAEVRRRCRARAEEVLALIGGQGRVDAQRFGGRAEWAFANPGRAAGLLALREEDGSWRFDADQPGKGPFVGRDYHELGPDEAVELGTCARNAYEVLRYARIAGDHEAYDQMQTTLALMESFRVPRAAQVWEVPVHAPDVLAPEREGVDRAVRGVLARRWRRSAPRVDGPRRAMAPRRRHVGRPRAAFHLSMGRS